MGAFTYLFLILIWAGPLVLLQWLIGVDIVLKRWKVLLPGVIIPTTYLLIAESFALHGLTWAINPSQSLNITIPVIDVPVEEAVFFFMTNLLVVQGMILITSPQLRHRIGRISRLIRRGPHTVHQEVAKPPKKAKQKSKSSA